jgi:hypothetical protein
MGGGFRMPSVRVLVVLSVVLSGRTGLAQSTDLTLPVSAVSAYISPSGAAAFGFVAVGQEGNRAVDVSSILPAGSDVTGDAKLLVQRVWLASPTFRRQWRRLADGRVQVVITLDYPYTSAAGNAESVIERKGGMRAHIRLRGVERRGPEHLAHEVEHVLEQLDDVDLRAAVGMRIRGAALVQRPDTFETSRAVRVGRIVAAEFEADNGRR